MDMSQYSSRKAELKDCSGGFAPFKGSIITFFFLSGSRTNVKCSKASYSPFSFLFPQVSSSYFLIDYSLEHLIRSAWSINRWFGKGVYGKMYASKALFILIPMTDRQVQKTY
jgi:hypothetical protein